jgi:hypothetical protein
MLYLPHPSQKLLNDYFALIRRKMDRALAVSTIPDPIKAYLLGDQVLEELILGQPGDLITYSENLMAEIFGGYQFTEYETYNRGKRNKTPAQLALATKYSKGTEDLTKIFNYNSFISKDKRLSYWIAENLNRNTCTYCNRLYTVTVIKPRQNAGIEEKITRPQFDHWYAKVHRPALALSWYNLIPSCSVCNSSVKGDLSWLLADYVHPYIKTSAIDFSFDYIFKTINQLKVTARFSNGKAENMVKAMKLLEIYDAHSELELKDLFDLRHKYSENYLNTLLNKTFDNLKIGKKEAYRLVFGTEYDEEHFHKRPFSKFKRDILEGFGIKISEK